MAKEPFDHNPVRADSSPDPVLDYRSAGRAPLLPRGIVSCVTSGISVALILWGSWVIWFTNDLGAASNAGLLMRLSLVLLLPIAVIAAFVARNRMRTRPDLLNLAWVLILITMLFWILLIWYIKLYTFANH